MATEEPRVKSRKLEARPEASELISTRELELDPPVGVAHRKCTDVLFLLVFIRTSFLYRAARRRR